MSEEKTEVQQPVKSIDELQREANQKMVELNRMRLTAFAEAVKEAMGRFKCSITARVALTEDGRLTAEPIFVPSQQKE